MKKILILTAVFLTPFLANARQAEPEYIIQAREIHKNLAPVIYSLQEQAEQEGQQINKNLLKTCKQIIDSSKMDIVVRTLTSKKTSIVKDLFYNTGYIKDNLPIEIKEEQNAATLKALAEYILKDKTEMNDFEALLAIGIPPLEAAELTKNHCNIVIDKNANTITYDHFAKRPVGYSKQKITLDLNQSEK